MSVNFDKIDQFQIENLRLGLGKTPEQVKESYPTHSNVNIRIDQAKRKALDSLEEWQKTPRGTFGGLKKKLNPVGNFFRRMFRRPTTTVAPKAAAATPHKFEKISDGEKQDLEKKANLHKTLAKVLLIVGAILLGIGIFGPVVALPFLFIIPEVIVITIIATGTMTGLIGTASMVAYPFLKNSKAIKEHRAKTDLDFQKFVERFVQAAKDPDGKGKGGIGFNVKLEDLNDTKLHQIYLDWKKDVDAIFDNKKNQAKLQDERGVPTP